NWTWGPFELIDRIGAPWLAERLAAEGRDVPPLLARAAEAGGFYSVDSGELNQLSPAGAWVPVQRPPGVLLLSDVKRTGKAVAYNSSASLWDIGDGVLCLEFHSKMNAIDQNTLAMLKTAIETVKKGASGLVIHNEAENFSVGANIGLALFAANVA